MSKISNHKSRVSRQSTNGHGHLQARPVNAIFHYRPLYLSDMGRGWSQIGFRIEIRDRKLLLRLHIEITSITHVSV
jgi:hypothetical protein